MKKLAEIKKVLWTELTILRDESIRRNELLCKSKSNCLHKNTVWTVCIGDCSFFNSLLVTAFQCSYVVEFCIATEPMGESLEDGWCHLALFCFSRETLSVNLEFVKILASQFMGEKECSKCLSYRPGSKNFDLIFTRSKKRPGNFRLCIFMTRV
jgi:hypothetical protein